MTNLSLKEIVDMISNNDFDNFNMDCINALITCPKVIESDKITKLSKLSNKTECNVELKSVEYPNIKFEFRTRRALLAPENFSVILMLKVDRDFITLFRCNGPHSAAQNNNLYHISYHTHTISVEDMITGNYANPNIRNFAEYTSFGLAIKTMLKIANIANIENVLPKEIIEELNMTNQISFDDIERS